MYMNDRTHTCSNTQIRNDGGEESIAFLEKTQLAATSLCSLPSSRHGENVTQHLDKQIPSHFYGAEKACNTAIQNHYALDVNQLKQRPVNTQALSKFIMCAVQKYIYFYFKGAFTPDANDANRANDLHVKSMQRRERQSCGAIRTNEAARIERFFRAS